MKLIMVPVIFTVGFLMFEQRDKMMDLYHAAYPVDPVKAQALKSCAENPNFNRLDSGDRAACYSGNYGKKEEPVLTPTPQPYYAYNPSHLPGNDIRREEANSAYMHGETNPALADIHQAPHPVLHPTVPHHYYVHPHVSATTSTTSQQ